MIKPRVDLGADPAADGGPFANRPSPHDRGPGDAKHNRSARGSRIATRRVLFVATVLHKHIEAFHLPYLKWFKDHGYETHVCARNDYADTQIPKIPYCDKYFDVAFERSPFSAKNLRAYAALRKLIRENDYDIIHCHTPVGGMLTRLAARHSRQLGTQVIYTAHGFHFYRGAPMRNWVLFYPVERALSRYTDCLITINQEDFDTALRHRFAARKIRLVDGVGVDVTRFRPPTAGEKDRLRRAYGYSSSDFLLVFAGELNAGKGQDLLIRMVSRVKESLPDVRLILLGDGPLRAEYEQLIAKEGLGSFVNLMGFREDVEDLLAMSDLAVSASHREGLPVNIIEALAVGLPIVATDCRGNRDLVEEGVNGHVVPIGDIDAFCRAVQQVRHDVSHYERTSNRQSVAMRYGIDHVVGQVAAVYRGLGA